MRRALRSGSILGAATVALTVVSTLFLLVAGQHQSLVFEVAYTINVITYAVAAFRAVRRTGEPGAATMDALIAATWAGSLGTVLQAALLGVLDGGILVAVLVMLVIEWVTAVIVAPFFGLVGIISRKLVPLPVDQPAVAAESDAPAA